MQDEQTQVDTGEGTVSYECGAFLTGTLAEYWEERGIVVPVWAWLNLLAHGSRELIAESMARPNRSRRAAHSWRTARSYLAEEIFDLLDDEFTLADMQSSVLVPLELTMAAQPQVSRWSPRRWVDAVDHAIRNEPSTLGFGRGR